MKRETFEKQKAFAGEKVPSMKRRCVGHDYTRRGLYMLTMVVEGRRPLFCRICGTSDNPCVELTPLGSAVRDEWWGLSTYYPQIKVLDLQMMPDHIHGILYVHEPLPCDLSRVVRGFKSGCGRAYRRLCAPLYVATESQHTPKGSHPKHGLLFEPGFNDRILKEPSQLPIWRQYLRDNPRRLLMKREHPDLFRVQRDLMVGGQSFSAIGNRFLLQYPIRLQVQCSRSLTDEQINAKAAELLALARQGAVLVSPCISPGEKRIMRQAFDEGLPLIILQENGFTDLAKPGGQRMDACARGQLLLLAPWAHHNERLTIQRNQCLMLNDMARLICES